MARTINEIYAEIIAYKDGQIYMQNLTPQNDTTQQLSKDLDSSSKVAIWRLWVYIVAVAIHVHEKLFDIFAAEIDAKISSGIWGTSRWYQEQMFLFQHGYLLQYNPLNGRYEYAQNDDAAKIIKRCSVTESANGLLIIKVAKFDNLPIALSPLEVAAAENYVKKIRFAGTLIQVITGNGDILRIALDVIYDAILPQSIVQSNVEAAINAYISNLPFDGVFKIIHLIDAIQAVEGVTDIGMQSGFVQVKIAQNANYQDIQMFHVPNFGYYKIDDSAGNTLSDTINYVAV
jgi:hypothetical protein